MFRVIIHFWLFTWVVVHNIRKWKWCACNLNGITWGRLVGGYIYYAWVIMYLYTNPPVVQCHSDHMPNAFLLLYHALKCDLMHPHINFQFSFNIALTFDPVLALWDNGCSGVLNRRCTCCHTYHCEGFSMHGRWHSKRKMKSRAVTGVIMSLFVSMASKQAKFELVTHISSIYSTPRCRCRARTLHFEVPMPHFFKKVGRYGLSAFEFTVASQLFIQKVTHDICLWNVQHIYSPSPVENLPSAPEKECPITLFKFTTSKVVKMWILNKVVSRYLQEMFWNISACNSTKHPKKKICFIAEIITSFLEKVSRLRARGRTVTHKTISRLHTQVWYDKVYSV